MSYLSESWLQELITKNLGLPAVESEVVDEVLPFVELHVRRVIQQALKYQRRAKTSYLKVDDLNLVLSSNNIEALYGLHPAHESIISSSNSHTISKNVQTNVYKPSIISIEDFAKRDIPHCSLKPSVSLHWLAINGVQPSIPENPSIIDADDDKKPTALPKELQYLYARITGVIKNFDQNEEGLLTKVLTVLATDTYLQDLVPYFSHFCYSQVKLNSKNVPLLSTIVKTIHAMFTNPTLRLEAHLTQLLPAIFTCVVAAKLCNSSTENHWYLRREAAALIAFISEKYSSISPDLHARICKTYFEAISQQKSLTVAFGGVAGINALGSPVVRSLLLWNLSNLASLIDSSKLSMEQSDCTNDKLLETRLGIDMLKDVIRQTLGNYITSCMQMPVLPFATNFISQSGKNNKKTTEPCKEIDSPLRRKRRTLVARIQPSISYPLMDLEESLTPYFVKESKSLYYSRLVL